jgi:hypothetical protein
MSWRTTFPHLYELYSASDTSHPDNYFATMGSGGSPQLVEGFLKWEEDFAHLDQVSRADVIKRAGPLVTQKAANRGWSALFNILNEIRGYSYLKALGYSVTFIPPSKKQGVRTPDLHGTARLGDALLEVKTVNMSDHNASTYGVVQEAHNALPEGFKQKLLSDYRSACEQLHAYVVKEPTRRICAFFITIDRQLAFNPDNKRRLEEFVATLETDCEIYCHSGYW